ncbi:acyl carrier protein [Lachnotalea glycerini]|uniref:Acyl carrier protein n=1 Tax=Lachnotalea glycerini TaxID=1763509 RepID=A0A318EST6_9FIRM|nr:phosphopantetheine-binding protein [Lachnotalea glycerini]PXV95580.1 acyl carrier protein [Lachnotalea glycerini]
MDDKEIGEVIIKIIHQAMETNIEIELNNRLEEIRINSMSFVKIIVGIESYFDLNFEDDKLSISYFNTVMDLVHYTLYLINQ